MELNEKNLGTLAASINMPVEDLTKALTTAESSLNFEGYQFLSKDDLEQYENNIKDGLLKGETKWIEHNRTLRELKRQYNEKYGIETDGIKDFDELFNKTLEVSNGKYEIEKEELKKQISGEQNTLLENLEMKIKTVEGEKEKLQLYIKEKELEFNNNLTKKDEAVKSYKANHVISRKIGSLVLDVPAHIEKQGDEAISNYLNMERNKAEILFKSNFNIDFDEKDTPFVIDKTTNEPVKTKMQALESIDVVVNNFAKSYNLNVKSEDPKERTSAKKMTNNLIGMTMQEFDEYAKSKGLKTHSAEYGELYKTFKKVNDKN